MLPFATVKAEQLQPYAGLVEWTGVRRLWQGQSLTIEPHQAFSYLAGNGTRIPLGLGVTLMPLRHPFEAAVQAASLARITGQQLTIGYGPGSRNFQSTLLTEPYPSPLTASREYIGIVKGLLAGGIVETDGEYFSCHGRLVTGPTPRIEVALGVLRPKMAALAGEIADAAITWLTPATYVRDAVLPAIQSGAAARGVQPRLVSMVPVALSRPGRVPAEVALASNEAHLRAPHYLDMLAKAGVAVTRDHCPLEAAKAVVDAGAFLSGNLDQLLTGFKEYEAAGVDELVLNLTGVYLKFGPAKALADLKLLLKAVGVL